MNQLNIVNNKMTTLDFAELTGTPHNDVLKKARKLLNDLEINEGKFSSIYKDSMNREKPMLSLDRDLSLTLAGQYEPKIAYAVSKAFNNQPQLSQLEMLSQGFAKMAEIEFQQSKQTKEIAEIKARQENMDGNTGYMTILSYARKNNIPEPLRMAQKHGKACTRLSKELNIQIGRVSDERWGQVNSYHVDVLGEVIM